MNKSGVFKIPAHHWYECTCGWRSPDSLECDPGEIKAMAKNHRCPRVAYIECPHCGRDSYCGREEGEAGGPVFARCDCEHYLRAQQPDEPDDGPVRFEPHPHHHTPGITLQSSGGGLAYYQLDSDWDGVFVPGGGVK